MGNQRRVCRCGRSMVATGWVIGVLTAAAASIAGQPATTTAPSAPAAGKICGVAVTLDKAVYANSVLTLTSTDPSHQSKRLEVHLRIAKGVMPSGQTVSIDPAAKMQGLGPNVAMHWLERESGVSHAKFADTRTCRLRVTFDQEADGRIAGSIEFDDEQHDTHIAGRFDAKTEGLRLIDGKPDLQSDAFETLVYAVQLHLQGLHTDQAVTTTGYRHASMNLDGARSTGRMEVGYKLADGTEGNVRARLRKNAQGWYVAQTLRTDQLFFAHPLEPIVANAHNNWELVEVACGPRLEAELQKELAGKGFWCSGMWAWHYKRKPDVGAAVFEYEIDGQEGLNKRTYLMDKKDGQWVVRRALAEGETFNSETGQVERVVMVGGRTLHEAIEHWDLATVKALIEAGADLEAVDRWGRTPLVRAIWPGQVKFAATLIAGGVDVNGQAGYGSTPLHLAVHRAAGKIVEALIAAGAKVDAEDADGMTALDVARRWELDEIAAILVAGGATVRSPATSQPAATSQPVGIASGRIKGTKVTLGYAVFENRMLYLQKDAKRYGKGHAHVRIDVPDPEGVIPWGKTYTRGMRQPGFNHPMQVFYAGDDSRTGKTKPGAPNWPKVRVSFAQQTDDGRLRGTVLLESPHDGLRIEGSFNAKIEGLRLIDGHPDLRSDHVRTLRYAAELYLREKYADKKVTLLEPTEADRMGVGACWMRDPMAKGGSPMGQAAVRYQVDGAEPAVLRAMMVKKGGRWQVGRELRGDQLVLAHPPEVPDVKERSASTARYYLSAVALEEDLQRDWPGRAFNASPGPSSVFSKKHGIGEVHVKYWFLDELVTHRKTYLLRRGEDGWAVERELKDDERVDTKRGVVVTK